MFFCCFFFFYSYAAVWRDTFSVCLRGCVEFLVSRCQRGACSIAVESGQQTDVILLNSSWAPSCSEGAARRLVVAECRRERAWTIYSMVLLHTLLQCHTKCNTKCNTCNLHQIVIAKKNSHADTVGFFVLFLLSLTFVFIKMQVKWSLTKLCGTTFK